MRSFIDPNDQRFIAPGDMPARIAEYCVATGQPKPETPGQILRTALESLAMRYRQSLEEIEAISGKPIELLHLVGGGCKNIILNQFTANAIQRPLLTGPVEATACPPRGSSSRHSLSRSPAPPSASGTTPRPHQGGRRRPPW